MIRKQHCIFAVIAIVLASGRAWAGEGEAYRFVVVGDSRPAAGNLPQPAIFDQILHEINLIKPAFVIHTGDLVYSGRKEQYNDLERTLSMLDVPFYPAIGNHETPHGGTAVFCEMFGLEQPWYAFSHGSSRFIVVCTDYADWTRGGIYEDQLPWFEEELIASASADHVFVIMHRPLFSTGPKRGDTWANKEKVLDLLQKHRVKAVFAGHEHIFDHLVENGTEFVITGGGGSPLHAPPEHGGFYHYLLVEVDGAKVSFQVLIPGQLSMTATLPGTEPGMVVVGNDNRAFNFESLDGRRVECPAAPVRLDGLQFQPGVLLQPQQYAQIPAVSRAAAVTDAQTEVDRRYRGVGMPRFQWGQTLPIPPNGKVVAAAASVPNGELVAVALQQGALSVLRQRDGREEYAVVATTALPGVTSLAVADMDGDGSAEVVAGTSDGRLVVHQLAANVESMKPWGEISLSAHVQTIVAVNLDEDDALEIVAGCRDGGVWLIKAHRDGVLSRVYPVLHTDASLRGLAVEDCDGDGAKEIFVCTGSDVVLYERQPSGAYGESWRAQLPEATLRVACDDVNFDGKKEVIVLSAGALTVFERDKDGQFVQTRRHIAETSVHVHRDWRYDLVVGPDLDQNGKKEIILADGEEYGRVRVFETAGGNDWFEVQRLVGSGGIEGPLVAVFPPGTETGRILTFESAGNNMQFFTADRRTIAAPAAD